MNVNGVRLLLGEINKPIKGGFTSAESARYPAGAVDQSPAKRDSFLNKPTAGGFPGAEGARPSGPEVCRAKRGFSLIRLNYVNI